MKTSMKSIITNLSPGTIIQGKWHSKTYEVVRKLGFGAIGTVYLAQDEKGYVALKISDQSSSITTEVNVLKAFQKVQGVNLGPSLLDVDDWVLSSQERYPFYVMEYLHGENLNGFLHNKGTEWLSILIIQLLDNLDHLHQANWVFGDLKPENLIVTRKPTRVRWIDVGGTTMTGRAIKEYTEFYDRGYWGLGSRKAEPSYDLFAVGMIMIQVFYPKRFERGQNPEKTLKIKIQAHPELRKYEFCITKALVGSYASSKEMKRDLMKVLLLKQKESERRTVSKSRSRATSYVTNKSRNPQASTNSQWKESIGIVMVSAVFFVLFLIINMF